MKYVVFEHTTTGNRQPVLFSDLLAHSDISIGAGWRPVSAGFVDVRRLLTNKERLGLVQTLVGTVQDLSATLAVVQSVAVSGGSDSLGLEGRAQDALPCCLLVNGLESAMVMGCEERYETKH